MNIHPPPPPQLSVWEQPCPRAVEYNPTHVAFGHFYPPLISNDKLWLIFFLIFCAFFLNSFISNTSIVSINFRASLDAQNAGNGISSPQISNIFCGSMPPDPPIYAWYVGYIHGLQLLLSPSNISSHRKVPFQKMAPTGISLEKAPILCLLKNAKRGREDSENAISDDPEKTLKMPFPTIQRLKILLLGACISHTTRLLGN